MVKGKEKWLGKGGRKKIEIIVFVISTQWRAFSTPFCLTLLQESLTHSRGDYSSFYGIMYIRIIVPVSFRASIDASSRGMGWVRLGRCRSTCRGSGTRRSDTAGWIVLQTNGRRIRDGKAASLNSTKKHSPGWTRNTLLCRGEIGFSKRLGRNRSSYKGRFAGVK